MSTTIELELGLSAELMTCPECLRRVHTTAAEGIPAQSLRSCDECGAAFFMDLDSKPTNEPQPATAEGEGVGGLDWPCAKGEHDDCAGQAHRFGKPEPGWDRCPCDCHKSEEDAQPTTPHTATPWRLYGKQIQGFPNGDLQRKIIATVTTDAEQDTNDANGQLIVQAVNAHAALVEALQRMAVWLLCPAIDAETIAEMRAEARAALKLAGKRASRTRNASM